MLDISFLMNLNNSRATNLRVLVVDDAELMRDIITMTLKQAGIETVEAGNGNQAYTLAKDNSFDLIITDIRMPDMDGLELIRKLRDLPKYKETPILGLTNLNSDNFKEQLKQSGANGWVQKPFGRDSLIKTIESLVA